MTMPTSRIENNAALVNMVDAESNRWAQYIVWLRGGARSSGGPAPNLETIVFDVEAAALPNPQ